MTGTRLIVAQLLIIAWLAMAGLAVAADESPAPALQVEIQGPNVRPGYPDAFAFGYKFAENSVSPDGKFALVYCDDPSIVERNAGRNFLVALNPLRILAVVDAYRYYDRHDVSVEWTKDSSVALVSVPGKWGPIGFTVFEFRNGRVTRQTDLYAQMARLLEPGVRQAKVQPYNDIIHFILDSEGEGKEPGTQIDADGKAIHVHVFATSNPKAMDPPMKTWGGHLEAVWSIPEARWVTHKVTSSTYRQ
jgi:hypothetical protein